MANKWKYSSLPASERINMIRNGNKDVFDNEIARAKDVINSRQVLGLDITEQKNWIDTLGYNYNLYNAKNMGIDADKVNKTGYADEILGTREKKSYKKESKIIHGPNEKTEKLKEIMNESMLELEKAYAEIENVEEMLFNKGIDKDSTDGKKFMNEAKLNFSKKAQKIKDNYLATLEKLMK